MNSEPEETSPGVDAALDSAEETPSSTQKTELEIAFDAGNFVQARAILSATPSIQGAKQPHIANTLIFDKAGLNVGLGAAALWLWAAWTAIYQ